MVVEVKKYPTARKKNAKVPISELILHQRTADNKPIFISVMNKYNVANYEALRIKLYTKQVMDFGKCSDGYLVHYFPEAKDDIYKAFFSSAVEAAQGEVWDEEAKRLVNLQEK